MTSAKTMLELADEIEDQFEDVYLETFEGGEWSDRRRLTNAEKEMVVAALRAPAPSGAGEVKLRTSERMLLEWLQKGDGQYGECQGDTLNDLIARGLAMVQGDESGLSNGFIAKGTDIMHRVVSITDAGRAALAAPLPTTDTAEDGQSR
jgi:hypothetical protein